MTPKAAGGARHGGLLALLPFALLVLVTGCASNPPEADDVYRSGLARAEGDTPGAIKIFEDGVAAYPNHTRMRFALARLEYDTGEAEHLEERRAMLESKRRQEDGKAADAQALAREAQDHRSRAFPSYKKCREQLKIVAAKDDDQVRQAWAYVLLMKCDVFFEDYTQAADDLEKAMDLGNLPPEKITEWKEYLRELQAETNTKKQPRSW